VRERADALLVAHQPLEHPAMNPLRVDGLFDLEPFDDAKKAANSGKRLAVG